MKIMVVGSSGYIGRHVVKHLAAEGADVVAFDLVPAPAQWYVPGVPFIQGNMANLEEVMVGDRRSRHCNASSPSATT